MTIIEVTLKLLLAVALGGLIGLERESNRKPAGFRTNILICTGSTMIMILAYLTLPAQGAEGIVGRIAAGVITGIGFIGAGTIIQARGSVTGLTSAAGLWTGAILGLVIGAGHYLIALIFTGIVMATLTFFRKIEEHRYGVRRHRYRIKTQDSREVLFAIKKIAIHEGLRFRSLTLRREADASWIEFKFHPDEEKEKKFQDSAVNLEGILEIDID